MQSQYLITKDENGNYVIANSQDGEKLCGLNCSGDDPCKNCDKCVKQQPVIAPTLMPSLIPSPTPLPLLLLLLLMFRRLLALAAALVL